jgi:hypothetical protein
MLPEDIPFRVTKVNSQDEILARANKLVIGRTAYEAAVKLFPGGPDPLPAWREGTRLVFDAYRRARKARLASRVQAQAQAIRRSFCHLSVNLSLRGDLIHRHTIDRGGIYKIEQEFAELGLCLRNAIVRTPMQVCDEFDVRPIAAIDAGLRHVDRSYSADFRYMELAAELRSSAAAATRG